MPILRGAVTFSRFRVQTPEPANLSPAKVPPAKPSLAKLSNEAKQLGKSLKNRGFEPIDRKGDEERSAGFVELEDHDSIEFAPGNLYFGEYALFSYRVETLKVPSALLKAEHEKWCREYEREKGHPPKRYEKTENRLALRQALRSRAVPTNKVHDICWNLKTGEMQIWASSRTVVDEIQQAIEKACDLTLAAMVPLAVAQALGIDEKDLQPTAELSWPEFEGEANGKA